MRHFICIAVALCISAVTLRAQDQPKFSPAQQEVLDAHKARIAAGEKRDYVIHVYGNTAVLNYRLTLHEQFTDSDIISEQRYTETYIKQNGSWLLVAKHWTNLPVNFHKPVAVDTSVYKDYVGQYSWRPLDDPETVSLKDGKLWTDFGEHMDQEYFPLGAETFFVKTDLGSITFVRDAQGHVTGYTYHRWDGQEIHAKKIK
jgi:hypothetical protein